MLITAPSIPTSLQQYLTPHSVQRQQRHSAGHCGCIIVSLFFFLFPFFLLFFFAGFLSGQFKICQSRSSSGSLPFDIYAHSICHRASRRAAVHADSSRNRSSIYLMLPAEFLLINWGSLPLLTPQWLLSSVQSNWVVGRGILSDICLQSGWRVRGVGLGGK